MRRPAEPSVSNYALTRRAERQLRDIQVNTIENFGNRQAIRYLESLKQCFELLALQPRMGRRARNIGPMVRRHEHQSHVILYEISGEMVLILAIVHRRNLSELEV